MKKARVSITALLCAGTAGCWPEKKPAVLPVPAILLPYAPPQDGNTAPPVPTEPQPLEETLPIQRATISAPAVTEQPAGTQAPPAGNPTPQLGEILSEQRRRELQTRFDRSAGRAKAALSQALRAKLTMDQTETVARIRTFLGQAEAAKQRRELVIAQQLARRADLLGADLLQSLR
jgi:hypothetical protein